MKESIRQRLEKMTDRFEEVGRLLATADIAGGSQQFRDLSMEYARLQPLAEAFGGYHNLERDLATAQEMLGDGDPDMRTLGAEEVGRVGRDIAAAEADLRKLLIPKDPRDDKNIFLEIRAGTGGDEAAIFAGDLFRMYSRYAENHGLTVEIVSENRGEHGGYRVIAGSDHGTRDTTAHRIGAFAGEVREIQYAKGEHDPDDDEGDDQALGDGDRDEIDKARNDVCHCQACSTMRSVLT